MFGKNNISKPLAREVFSINSAEWLIYMYRKRIYTEYTKIHSKWIIDLNIKLKSTQHSKESLNKNCFFINFLTNTVCEYVKLDGLFVPTLEKIFAF